MNVKRILVLSVVFGIMLTSKSFAATTSRNVINYQMIVSPTLTATCPSGVVSLGTWSTATSPTATAVTCTVTQNRSAGTLSITASPAVNVITLIEPVTVDTYTVNFTSYSFSTGTLVPGGTFATGLAVTNPARGTSTFTFSATPTANIPAGKASGTYTGSHSLTFSLI